MKYPLNPELKSLAKLSGSLVGRCYPLLNAGYARYKCRSDEDVTVTSYQTPGYGEEELTTLVIEPKGCRDKLPCMVFYHGGGFLLKASMAHYQVAKWYALKVGCKVVFADYRLLPENRYPVAVEDCYRTYVWALEHADMLQIDPERMLVTGDSAGGNIACAVTMMLHDRNMPLPKGMLLVYPVLDQRMETESMQRFTDTPIWDARCNRMFWEMYLKDVNGEDTKYASIAEADTIAYFPPVYLEVAEFDCLHDEGLAFAKRLKADGISVEVHDVKGACHGYESVLKSSMVDACMKKRIAWIYGFFPQ